MYYLIRSNIEDEGWTNDGIFAEKEAREQLEAMLRSAQIAEIEGHHFEYAAFALDEKRAYPVQMISRRDEESRNMIFTENNLGSARIEVPLPAPLDY